MLRSLFSGITGLRQHQTMMDVVGNNIANVNTAGYKSSSAVFEDTLSQMVRAAGAPASNRAGMDPAQVGLGVQLGGIGTNFSQGSAQSTGIATNLMVQGDGFFIVKNGNENLYTRAGAFTFDGNGTLVNNQGMAVQGWAATNGVVNTNGTLTDVKIPTGTLLPPAASTLITTGGNITSGGTTDLTVGQVAYDSAGNAHPLSITLTYNAGTDGYDVSVADAQPGSTSTDGSITWPASGQPADAVNPEIVLSDGTTVAIDLAAITRFGGPATLGVKSADGAAAGTLQQFRITPDGTVIGLFSNGKQQNLAQVALSNFNNPGGLEKIGSSTFRTTNNSGIAQIGTAGGGGRGLLLGGPLEMSNVDLAAEFTNLIIAQRGFQANSRVITTSDQMLEELVNIKR